MSGPRPQESYTIGEQENVEHFFSLQLCSIQGMLDVYFVAKNDPTHYTLLKQASSQSEF